MPDLPVGVDVVIARTMAKTPDERFSTASEMTDSLEAIARPVAPKAAPVVLPAPEQPLPEDQPASPPIAPVLEVAADLAVVGAVASDATEMAPPMEVSPPDFAAEHPETEISPPDFDAVPDPATAPSVIQEEPLPETEVARPIFPTKPEDPKKSPLRNPILLAGLAVAAFIILAGVILAATGVFSPDQEGTAQVDVTEPAPVEPVSSAGDAPDEEPVVEDQDDAQPAAAAPVDQRDQALAFMEEAYALFDEGDHDAALARATMAIELDPEYADHYFQRGQLLNWMEDYQSALGDLNRAIELEPRSGYYFERGIAYRGSGESEAAMEDFHQAIELEPGNPAPYIDLAAQYRYHGDFDASLELLDVAIGLDPDSAHALTERAQTFDELGNFEASLEDSLRAFELTPEDSWLAEHIAEIYAWDLGEWDRALVFFNVAIDQNPEEAWRFTERAITLRMLGDGEAAIADHDRAIELEPSESWHRIEKAFTLRDMFEDPEGAIRVLEEAMEIGPEDPELYIERAQIRANDLGDYEGAIADADMAIELDPGAAWRYGFRAGLHKDLGDLDAALADYIRATEFDTTDAWSFIDLGYFYYDDLGEMDPAFDAWNIAVEREPDNPDAYHARYLYFAHVAEDFDAAISDLSRCLELDPEKAWCYWERAWLFDTIEDIGGAVEDFQRFLELIDVEECPECVQEASEFIESHS
jgi:tetratricopeptide (TPR) repeat protein